MQDIKENHANLWNEFEMGNFCITKSNVNFTSIGPDRAIEHENRKMKVAGIVGITQNGKALQRLFLAAPHLSAIANDFKTKFGLNKNGNMNRHHELGGSKCKRIGKNVALLCNVITEHEDPFVSNEDCLFNVFTHTVIPENAEFEILNRDTIGQKLFEDFSLTLDGSCSVWSPIKKVKISSFKSSNKTVNVTNEKESSSPSGRKEISCKDSLSLLEVVVNWTWRNVSVNSSSELYLAISFLLMVCYSMAGGRNIRFQIQSLTKSYGLKKNYKIHLTLRPKQTIRSGNSC